MRTYVKKNHKYWNMKKISKHSGKVWRVLIILMSLFVIYALTSRWVNRDPLVSPVVLNPVTQVMASEFISCENPKGYLECQVYAGKITWAQHDRIAKIIQCESKWNPDAVNTKNKNGSYDMGLLQINSIHKNISNADKLDYKKSIDWAIKKMHKDGNLNAWVCNRKVK